MEVRPDCCKICYSILNIFVLITDEKAGEIKLGPLDVMVDCQTFTHFAGPLIALRKLFCLNSLNESAKRLKLG